jgi:hypothetical protein
MPQTRAEDSATFVASGKGASFEATIANGASLSSAVDLQAYRLGRIVLPAAIDGTAMTFQTSLDGVTWKNLYNEFGSEYSVVIGADRSVVPDLTMFAAAAWLKVRTGTAAAPTAQTAARTIQLATLS